MPIPNLLQTMHVIIDLTWMGSRKTQMTKFGLRRTETDIPDFGDTSDQPQTGPGVSWHQDF